MKWTLYSPFAPSKAGESWKCGSCLEAEGAVVFCGSDESKELHDARVHGLTLVFEVQTGRHSNTYQPRYRFQVRPTVHHSQAWLYYSSINTNTEAGFKKRLIRREVLTGITTTLAREL